MTAPSVPVSWGELWDKIAILRIKVDRLRDPSARANAAHELAALTAVGGEPPRPLRPLLSGLLAVNLRLWRIEDRIREHEAAGDFGPTFVALARSVYRENDERWRIKAAINRVLGSEVVEEKQYSAYGQAP
ncbi:MAG TPA: DUF6165 family protein [Rhodopila sp.]|uniref:DUF6165 family protein n=1 Tax=Rhodopila sp. TaxID=2480087 RepID=UPI002BA57D4B|nr:DUF6165 family protein [Rhodopila sp.]HVY14733.1 DUF6165 family protein [Rhodopila sp.]